MMFIHIRRITLSLCELRVAGVGFVHEKHERYEKVGWVEAIAETHHLRIRDGVRYRSTHPTALKA